MFVQSQTNLEMTAVYFLLGSLSHKLKGEWRAELDSLSSLFQSLQRVKFLFPDEEEEKDGTEARQSLHYEIA